jgi:hypothetical protein
VVARPQRLTCHTSACFRSQTLAAADHASAWLDIRPVIQQPPPGAAGSPSWFPVAFRPTGVRFLGILFPPGTSASLTVGLPARHNDGPGPCRGFHVPHASDTAGIGCPLYPGDGGVHTDVVHQRPPPAASQRLGPCLPGMTTRPGQSLSRGISKDSRSVTHPAFPWPVTPGRSRSPWAFPWASHPAVTSHARHGRDRSRTLTRSHVADISRPPIDGLTHHVRPHVAMHGRGAPASARLRSSQIASCLVRCTSPRIYAPFAPACRRLTSAALKDGGRGSKIPSPWTLANHP